MHMTDNDANGTPLIADFHTCFPDAMGLIALALETGQVVAND